MVSCPVTVPKEDGFLPGDFGFSVKALILTDYPIPIQDGIKPHFAK